MPGRTLRPESSFAGTRYDAPAFARRRSVLRETLAAFEDRGPTLRSLAAANLARWKVEAPDQPPRGPEVWAADWGDAALALTRAHGETFAVLNMANAYVPGGAYVEGTSAQEENLFRRTDAHFFVLDEQLAGDRYRPEMTDLLSGRTGRVYLDTTHSRTCIRGPEDRKRPDLGYPWLFDDEVFPFYELRAAAQNAKREGFDELEANRRIEAQLDTLVDAGCRHAVLSAFGCGAFANPPPVVAEHYRTALEARKASFDRVVFAVYYPGYGPDNYSVFKDVFDGQASANPA